MGGNFVVKAQPYYPPLDAACFHKSPEDFKNLGPGDLMRFNGTLLCDLMAI